MPSLELLALQLWTIYRDTSAKCLAVLIALFSKSFASQNFQAHYREIFPPTAHPCYQNSILSSHLRGDEFP